MSKTSLERRRRWLPVVSQAFPRRKELATLGRARGSPKFLSSFRALSVLLLFQAASQSLTW